MDSFIVFIPARGGSKSIPLKNIKTINGKPLIYWPIKAACDCGLVDRVYLSTDSEDIKSETPKHIKHEKLWVIDRHKDTATDNAQIEDAMLDFAEKYDFQHIIMMQPTSPLVTTSDLSEAVRKYLNTDCDSLVSVCRQKRFIWAEFPMWTSRYNALPINYNYLDRPRRQESSGFLVENGAIFITSKTALLDSRCRISGNIALYEMPEDTYYELDEPTDWVVVEQLLKNRLEVNDVK